MKVNSVCEIHLNDRDPRILKGLFHGIKNGCLRLHGAKCEVKGIGEESMGQMLIPLSSIRFVHDAPQHR